MVSEQLLESINVDRGYDREKVRVVLDGLGCRFVV